ncbi:hypothetical protein LguiB_002449 [Lonicera macranthoides]
MSNIDRDYENFINQTDIRSTQPILKWGLINLEEQRLVRTAHFRSGGTFPYLHHVCKWVSKEVRKLPDLENATDNYIQALVENIDEKEVNNPRRDLPQGRDNALVDVTGGIHDFRRVLQETLEKLKFVQRRRLAETAEFLCENGGIRRLRFIETASTYNLRAYRQLLSNYGDQELDSYIENNILTPVRDIVYDINWNIPDYSWSENLKPPPPPSSPSESDSDSPAEDPSDNFYTDDNRNTDIDDIDCSGDAAGASMMVAEGPVVVVEALVVGMVTNLSLESRPLSLQMELLNRDSSYQVIPPIAT